MVYMYSAWSLCVIEDNKPFSHYMWCFETDYPRQGVCVCVFQDSQQSVTAVVFQDEHLLTTAGAVDG